MNTNKTPKTIATTVKRENERAWWVECECEGCSNIITVGKVSTLPGGDTITYTAPGARFCGLHGMR